MKQNLKVIRRFRVGLLCFAIVGFCLSTVVNFRCLKNLENLKREVELRSMASVEGTKKPITMEIGEKAELQQIDGKYFLNTMDEAMAKPYVFTMDGEESCFEAYIQNEGMEESIIRVYWMQEMGSGNWIQQAPICMVRLPDFNDYERIVITRNLKGEDKYLIYTSYNGMDKYVMIEPKLK